MTNICNSAAAPAQTVTVNADIADRPGDRPTAALLFFSNDSQVTWTALPMTRIATPGYDSTHQAEFPNGLFGSYYYIQASNGTNLATGSPLNQQNAWPPTDNPLALAAPDPIGDAIDPEGNWLDLTGAYVGRSASHFYAALTNNHTSWPTYRFPQSFFAYSLGLVNPQAPSDSWVFAMAYADIPAVFTTGLFLINRYTSAFTRIANIEAQTSGNRLYFRCPIASFTADEHFGPWPNSVGWLAAAATTQTILPIGGNYLRDTTPPARFYADRTPFVPADLNRDPLLSQATVSPRSGPPGTRFGFNVTYTDADSNLPTEHVCQIDSIPYELVNGDHRYWAGAQFSEFLTGFADGWHRFYFRFSDGRATVETSIDSFYVGATGMAAAATDGSAALRAAPNPFRGRFVLAGRPGTVVRVFDAIGRLVLTSTIASEPLAISLEPGAYMVMSDGYRLRLIGLP